MRIGLLPIEIQRRIFEIKPNLTIQHDVGDFIWAGTAEGDIFWNEINHGNTKIFFDKYPIGFPENADVSQCYVSNMGNELIVHSFLVPQTATMILDKKKAELLLNKLVEFLKK